MTDAVTSTKDGVAVVTGAGRGLGYELVKAFLAKGMRVAGLTRSIGSLSGLAEESDGCFLPVVADVRDPAEVAAAFDRISQDLGPVTILINNAAVYPRRDILDETPVSFMDTVNTNLGGSFYACHWVLPGMMDLGFGRIVNVVTFADQAPIPFAAAYSVSKGAQKILTRALVAELSDRFPDIVINDWVPGALRTEMGLPDGLPPEVAARWGVNLAMMQDRDLQGTLFAQDVEILPPRSRKERVIQTLLGQKRAARTLT